MADYDEARLDWAELSDPPEYIGGQPFPADLWGRAPIRGRAVQVVHEVLENSAATGHGFTAGEIVDELIKAGVIPSEP